MNLSAYLIDTRGQRIEEHVFAIEPARLEAGIATARLFLEQRAQARGMKPACPSHFSRMEVRVWAQ